MCKISGSGAVHFWGGGYLNSLENLNVRLLFSEFSSYVHSYFRMSSLGTFVCRVRVASLHLKLLLCVVSAANVLFSSGLSSFLECFAFPREVQF